MSTESDWRLKANCIGVEGLFAAKKSETKIVKQSREARARVVCGACCVTTECLEFAMANNEKGIWGGTNDYEREQLRIGAQLTQTPEA